MDLNNQTIMRILAKSFERRLDHIRELRRMSSRIDKMEGDLNLELNQILDLYGDLRVQAQLELWKTQGKRLCPRCTKPRGAKTFGWLYVETRSSPYLSRAIYNCCRECLRGTPSVYNAHGSIVVGSVKRDNEFFLIRHKSWPGKWVRLETVFGPDAVSKMDIVKESTLDRNSPQLEVGKNLQRSTT